MKTMRITIGLVWLLTISFSVLAQEYDDMYFGKKDREKLKAERASFNANDKIDSDYKAFKKKHFNDEEELVEETVNPTDSYSARQINPEYIARSNSEQASGDEQNYFVEGYNPVNTTTPNYNNSYYSNNWNNNNWNNGWNNPYYTGFYGAGFRNTWNSPYYGGFNDPWYSPYNSWGSPYYNGFYSPYGYQGGWNMSLTYSWGNFYNPYNFYGYSPYYYGGCYYPTTVVYVNRDNNARATSYGKYDSRNGNISKYDPNARNSSGTSRDRNTTGRVSTTNRQEEYYNSRRSSALEYQRRFGADQNSSSTGRSSYGTRSSFDSNRSSYDSRSSNYNNSRSSYTPSRSSGSSGSSTSPSRSSSGSSTGRTRGGN
jgi:hypothetical protein